MKPPKNDMWPVLLGISLLLLMSASHLPMGLSGSGAHQMLLTAEMVQENSSGVKKEPPNIETDIPPTNDSEMVVKPDVPPNPDAVVTPPVVDPEMVVDPTTRQPMTEEKLEGITPEEFDKNIPEEK